MKVRTYAIITIRAHIAPYVVIAAALVERLTRDHETLHALAALAMIAAPLWLLWVTLRDPATVVDDPAAYQAWWADTCRAASARDWTPPAALEAGRHDARPAITALADVWTPEENR